jgi:hypothetical protein
VPQSDFKALTYFLKISEFQIEEEKAHTHTHIHTHTLTQCADILFVT